MFLPKAETLSMIGTGRGSCGIIGGKASRRTSPYKQRKCWYEEVAVQLMPRTAHEMNPPSESPQPMPERQDLARIAALRGPMSRHRTEYSI